MQPLNWFENDSRFILAHQQPATLIDLVLSRGLDSHRFLRQTGIFYDDIVGGELRISPSQFFRLINNVTHLIPANDISFLFGARLYPGNFGSLTECLLSSGNLFQALDTLSEHHLMATPLLKPVISIDDSECRIQWLDTCGAGTARTFLIESMMTAVYSFSRWLSHENLPWQFLFSYPRPRHIEQYEVQLSEQLHFNAQVDAMIIPVEFLYQPWPGASATANTVAQRACECLTGSLGYQGGLIEVLYRYLQHSIRKTPSLEHAAAHFHMSPSTFKRKLKKHHCGFQEILDQVRRHTAVYLFQKKGFSNEQVADYLNYADVNNFRRSFKRWTGMTPSGFRNA